VPEFLLEAVPNQEAIDFLKSKPVLSRRVFDGLLPELQARAFVVAKLENLEVAQNLRDRIADLPAGADWEDVKADVIDGLSPWLGEDEDAGQRAEMLLRTHGFQAYAAAAERTIQEQKDVFPYCQYLTMEDDRVRPAHAALDKLVVPTGDPFWDTHTPPWDWGCRCQKVPLAQVDYDEEKAKDAAKKPEERVVISGPRLLDLNQGRLFRALPGSKGIAENFNVTPSQTYSATPGSLKFSLDDLKARYDAPVWAAFETWAKMTPMNGGRTIWNWLEAATPAGAAGTTATAAVAAANEIVPPVDPEQDSILRQAILLRQARGLPVAGLTTQELLDWYADQVK
jgi:SPP1 gp7 family putative phage head morphogenesis protein